MAEFSSPSTTAYCGLISAICGDTTSVFLSSNSLAVCAIRRLFGALRSILVLALLTISNVFRLSLTSYVSSAL